MSDQTPPCPGADQIADCARILAAILAHPGVLATVPEETRIALLSAAGRVARPAPGERTKLAKGFRRRRNELVRERDRARIDESGIRQARVAQTFAAPPLLAPADRPAPRRLEQPRDCYVCKNPYEVLHFFYDSMCTECGDLNYTKRFQSAPLDGQVALITGGRVKIGFQTALKLLRAGAHVIVTTRFPRDAATRFAIEPDHKSWWHRLQLHGLDLRHTPSVDIFARYISSILPRLDILINNACQTVRRPPGFYSHLVEFEQHPIDGVAEELRPLLAQHEVCKAALHGPTNLPDPGHWPQQSGVGLTSSAQLSQIPYSFEQSPDDALFPLGKLDADLQQVDLRLTNSWRLTLAEVPIEELLEVHLVNAVAPYVLCAKLLPLMRRERSDQKHIVNVSAMEGKFTRGTKTDKHPHTNMAKASLNMMTLTAAPGLAKEGIFMNAVDTGWVTDEDPILHATRKVEELGFQPPLDIVDGAARVCDPIFAGWLSGDPSFGKFFKDYGETAW